MSGDFGYAMAFLTGLLGAGHCLGMCSGLAGGLTVHQGWRRLGPVVAYHGSRIAVYVVLGTLGAVLGRTLVQTGSLGKFQGQLMMLAGLVILVLGLRVAALLPWAGPGARDTDGLSGVAVRPPRVGSQWRARLTPVLAGLVNGLVPCSLVYSIATRATAIADPVQAALLMACFGLGTLPLMGAVTALGGRIGAAARGHARRLAGGIVALLGAWTLYEGMVFYQVMRGLAD
jgi:sulfite exporter TauE/SafE